MIVYSGRVESRWIRNTVGLELVSNTSSHSKSRLVTQLWSWEILRLWSYGLSWCVHRAGTCG